MDRWTDPYLVAAFSGWGDASSVATTTAAFLIQKRDTRREIEFDPEEFFVLTETRPWVRVGSDGDRRIQWPSLALMVASGGARDALVLLGPEPQLRWRSFAQRVATAWREKGGAAPVILIGAFLASVPHTGPVFLTGFATTPELRARLEALGVQLSGYEGPTSIHSAIADEMARQDIPCLSVWAAIPHYTGAMPNPKACAAILRVISDVIELELDLAELDDAAIAFEKQVTRAIAKSDQKSSSASEASAAPDDQASARPIEPLPPAEDVVRGVEEFFRRNRPSE